MLPSRRIRLRAIILGCFAVTFIYLLHPRLGIRDVDSYAYIMGARSLRLGSGYKSLTGEAFNHWPPGYSLLLSPFRDPLLAALVLNYAAFGIITALLFALLTRQGWTWQAAAGATAALGCGFFRLIANIAHPDILNYALFLIALAAFNGTSRRLPAALLWILLVPVKLIALVFLPAALAADVVNGQVPRNRVLRFYLPLFVALAISAGSVMVFNSFLLKQWIPASHQASSLAVLLPGARSFLVSIPRSFLVDWHGPLSAPFPRIAIPLCLLVAAFCMASLRADRSGAWFRVFGTACLLFSALLLCVRSYDPAVRLTGYGLVALLIGFRPTQRANLWWILYGLISVVIGTVNGLTVNSLGSNDPRYARLASKVGAYYKDPDVVATNSFHILDLHGNIASVPISNATEARDYQKLFRVTLPKFDPGASSVTPLAYPGPEWCEEKRFEGGVLFRRCQSPSSPAP